MTLARKGYNEVSYMCIQYAILWIVMYLAIMEGDVVKDWLHNRHENWLGTRYDWLDN